MARKTFCIPSLLLSFCALVLLLLTTISVPLATHDSSPFYIVEASSLNGSIRDVSPGANPNRNLTSIRAGLWGYCSKGQGETSYAYCSDNRHDYAIALNQSTPDSGAAYSSIQIKKSWTRGLVVAVVAFVFTVVGFALSFPPHLPVQLVAAIVLFLGMVLALVAFIIQIVFFVYLQNRTHKLHSKADVMPGPGFYLTLISIPLLLLSSLTVACGWKRERSGAADVSTGAGMSLPWKRNRNRNRNIGDDYAAGAGAGATYGSREYGGASTVETAPVAAQDEAGNNKDSIPLSSRQRVLEAFHKS